MQFSAWISDTDAWGVGEGASPLRQRVTGIIRRIDVRGSSIDMRGRGGLGPNVKPTRRT